MSTTSKSLQLKGLGKEKLAALTNKAKRLGMTPERYLKQLVEDDLALDHEAQTKSFQEIMGPGQPVNEVELDALVEKARTEYYQRRTKR